MTAMGVKIRTEEYIIQLLNLACGWTSKDSSASVVMEVAGKSLSSKWCETSKIHT